MAICEDCGTTISYGCRWCMPCAGVHRRKPIPACRECGRRLSSRRATVCRNCNATKQCEALKGQEFTLVRRRKLSLASTGRKHNEATKEKLSILQLARAQQSQQHPPNWRGVGFRSIRKRILERDRHACVKCGKTGRGLSVHHLKDAEATGGIWNNSDDNLQTLCRRCHFLLHMQQTRICVECGTHYLSANFKQLVCSPACKQQRRNRQQRATRPAWYARYVLARKQADTSAGI